MEKHGYWLGRVLVFWGDRLGEWGDRRRQRRCLGALDPRMLADAGISPSEAAWEAAKPFWKA